MFLKAQLHLSNFTDKLVLSIKSRQALPERGLKSHFRFHNTYFVDAFILCGSWVILSLRTAKS